MFLLGESSKVYSCSSPLTIFYPRGSGLKEQNWKDINCRDAKLCHCSGWWQYKSWEPLQVKIAELNEVNCFPWCSQAEGKPVTLFSDKYKSRIFPPSPYNFSSLAYKAWTPFSFWSHFKPLIWQLFQIIPINVVLIQKMMPLMNYLAVLQINWML